MTTLFTALVGKRKIILANAKEGCSYVPLQFGRLGRGSITDYWNGGTGEFPLGTVVGPRIAGFDSSNGQCVRREVSFVSVCDIRLPRRVMINGVRAQRFVLSHR